MKRVDPDAEMSSQELAGPFNLNRFNLRNEEGMELNCSQLTFLSENRVDTRIDWLTENKKTQPMSGLHRLSQKKMEDLPDVSDSFLRNSRYVHKAQNDESFEFNNSCLPLEQFSAI